MKKVNKKLSLNKKTVTNLNQVNGGAVEGEGSGVVCAATIGVSAALGGTCYCKTIVDPSCAVTCTQMTMCRPCQA